VVKQVEGVPIDHGAGLLGCIEPRISTRP
jgi:hypothetical protein